MDKATLYALDNNWTIDMLNAMNGDLFASLGINPWYPEDWAENPVNHILKNDNLWERLSSMEGVSGVSLVRAQVICQQLMWNFGRFGKGPEGDGLPKTLRKLWYAGHKEALQYISKLLDVWRNKESGQMNDVSANACMSTVYGEFVDTRLVTYLDMFVKDGSRQFEVFSVYNRLPNPLSNIVFCIEKDAAYEDCVRIAKALGAACALSGGGKMGKAGTENMVRQALSSWYKTETPGDLVTEENPCYVLVISDWDYDGESVIAPTFVEQMRRYIPDDKMNWCRVGIKPEQVERLGHDLLSKAYQVKYHVNSAYTRWCQANAIFDISGEAYQGEEEFDRVVDQAKYLSPTLGYALRDNGHVLKHDTLKTIFELCPPLGYELDALKRVEYAELIVEGLLTMISWDDLIDALSRKAWSNPSEVTESLVQAVLADNEDYQSLDQHITELRAQFEALIADLEGKKGDFESTVRAEIEPLVNIWKDDERIAEKDPVPSQDAMAAHLRQVSAWDHWQPFNHWDRNGAHGEVVEDEEEETLTDLRNRPLYFDRVTF